jgi:hypothetical protein
MDFIKKRQEIRIGVFGKIEGKQLEALPIMGLQKRLEVDSYGMPAIKIRRKIGNRDARVFWRGSEV